MNTKNGRRMSYRMMNIMAIIAGVFGIALLFMPDGEILAFMVSVAVLGGLIGGSKDYNEQERQQLGKSYATFVEWLLLVVMAAFALIVFSRWIIILEGTANFLNNHWPGLIISTMCLLMGIVGLRKVDSVGSV